MRFGVTAVSDRDPDAAKATEDQVSVWAADVEFPLVYAMPARVFLYGDAATIRGHGRGAALGLSANPGRFAGISGFGVRLERRFLGSHFLPEYIDAFYGVDRYDEETALGKETLLDLEPGSDGWYGELSGVILDAVEIVGGFSRAQGRSGSGVLHIDARSRPISQRWEISGGLNKTAIETLGDLTRQERTLAEIRVGYRLNPWSLVYVRLRRTFEKQEEGYRPVDVLIPRVLVSMAF